MWNHKDEWRMNGKNFNVAVVRHAEIIPEAFKGLLHDGGNRWCVYAHIFPTHPFFKDFTGRDLYQKATRAMPLHCGCSYLEYPMYDNVVSCVKVGADYNHYMDDFSHFKTKEEASEVFRDAEGLYKWLTERGEI